MRVVDTSVAVKWFVKEEDSEKAITLRNEHRQGTHILIAPDIILAETANALFFSSIFTVSEIKSCLQTV